MLGAVVDLDEHAVGCVEELVDDLFGDVGVIVELGNLDVRRFVWRERERRPGENERYRWPSAGRTSTTKELELRQTPTRSKGTDRTTMAAVFNMS